MAQYAIYLRKSRADIEAESRGEGETLARHRAALRALAQNRGLNVVREYAELVTGDSIAARPQMQLLLDDVKKGLYAGVIVNDVDRLGRGDSIDQEIIKYTFVAGHCLIITPTRDINPASPTDEDMLDFSLFFARFEYRKIAQRLTQGRIRSAQSGNYLASRVPFGYKKVVDGKKITLVPDENTAPIVKTIFEWYASKKYGYQQIAHVLNEMGVKTSLGKTFDRASVKVILTNPVYTGRIIWGKTATVSAIEDGRRVKKTIKGTPFIVEDAHPAIIDDKTFNIVQQMFDESQHAYPTHTNAELANPLAGLLYCSQCGHAMQIRGSRKHRGQIVTCVTQGCKTRGTYIHIIEETLLEILRSWSAEYREPTPEAPAPPADDTQAQVAKRQIELIETQITRAQELVEIGVYTPSEYMKRRNALQERLEAAKALIQEKPTPPPAETIHAILPAIERVLDAYEYAETPEQRNALLKSVVARVEYTKTEVATKRVSSKALMKLKVFPRIGNII